LSLVERFGENSWNRISKLMLKSEIKCHKRYLELSNRSHMVSAAWSKEEDDLLARIVKKGGPRNWTRVAMNLPGRIGKQCRERWHHHLNPEVVKKRWTYDEDLKILGLFRKLGSRWSEIARKIDGRTDNQIKNRYNSNLKRRYELGLFDKALDELEADTPSETPAALVTSSKDAAQIRVSIVAKEEPLKQKITDRAADKITITVKNDNVAKKEESVPAQLVLTPNDAVKQEPEVLMESLEHLTSKCKDRRTQKLIFKKGLKSQTATIESNPLVVQSSQDVVWQEASSLERKEEVEAEGVKKQIGVFRIGNCPSLAARLVFNSPSSPRLLSKEAGSPANTART